MKTQILKTLLGCALALIVTNSVANEKEFFNDKSDKGYYKWEDERGITHYSAHPPSDNSIQTHRIRTNVEPNSNDSAAMKRLQKNREQILQSAQERRESSSTDSTQIGLAETKEKNCNQARSNLKTLENNARVRRLDENGEYEYISEEVKQKQAQQSIDYINTYCN